MPISNNSYYCDQQFSALHLAKHTLQNTEFEACTFINCDLSQGQFKTCRFIECSFEHCNLSSIEWGYSSLENVSFSHCKLNSVQWSNADWGALSIDAPVSFNSCELSNCSFYELTLKSLKLIKNIDILDRYVKENFNIVISNFCH